MWDLPGIPFDLSSLGDLKPSVVLHAFDGPRIFACQDGRGQLLLAYQVAESDDVHRYFVVPANHELIESVRAGRRSLLDALDSRWGWLVDVGEGWLPMKAHAVDGIGSLPESVLPKPAVYLTGSAPPLLSVKAVGPQLTKDHVPASVVTRTVTYSTRALRRLLTYAIEAVGEDDRGDTWELLSDPPVSMLAASFQVSYYPPAVRSSRLFPAKTKSVLDELERLLTVALDWAADPNDQRLPITPGKTPAETEVLLQCLADLTPPLTGVVDRIEIGGKLVGGGRRVANLDRSARRLVTATQRTVAPTEFGTYFEESGVIAHVDWVAKSFRLVAHNDSEVFFHYGAELYDVAAEAYAERYPVVVVGRKDSQRNVAKLIAPTGAGESTQGQRGNT